MAPLNPADVKHWNADAIHSVFQTATDRVRSLQKLGDNLDQVHNKLSEWQGEAGDAFRADLGKTRHDIEADGHETKQVAAAVSRAETDVRAVKSELDRIEQAAQADGFTITSDWRIDSGSKKLDGAQAVIKEHLQGMLDACKLHAHNADQELAAAVRSAVTAAAGSTGADRGGGQPKSWQNMVLPTGPGSGDAAKGPPVGDGGEAGEPPSLQDMRLGPGTPAGAKPPSVDDLLLGRGTPAGQKPPEGDPLDLLDQIPSGATAIPAPPLKPEAIESFKAKARQTMINDGVPADQIEGRLNAIVANTQQWLDAGAPNYVAPEGPKPPAPGFAEGFADRLFSTEQGIKELFGQGGPGQPGVLQSWEQMLKGTVETATNPVGAAASEIQHAINSPSLPYYLGEKGADVAVNAPMMMFGGEGAAVRAGLPAELVTEGGAPLAVMRGWDPLAGMSGSEFDAQFGSAGARSWPGNDGFPPGYVPQTAHLPTGAVIDRFGSEYGRYLAPDGAPFADRALMPESAGGEYNRYMVTGKPLPPGWRIVEGPVEPYFGQTPSPGALQYMIVGPKGVTVSVKELLDRGILDDAGAPFGSWFK